MTSLRPAPALPRRWLLLAALTLALHGLAWLLLEGGLAGAPADAGADGADGARDTGTVVEARLQPAAPAMVRNVPAARPAPARRARPAVNPSTDRPQPQAALPPPLADTAPPPLPDAVAAALDTPALPLPSAPDPSATTTPAAPAEAGFTVNLPPPVTLKYDLEQRKRDGSSFHGSASIQWQPQGEAYTVQIEGRVLFFTVLSSTSQGAIDAHGLAPELYSEKPFRRAQVNTHFHRGRGEISFSASERIYPRKGGEQDRATLPWQLAGIGRGSGERFAPGLQVDIFVAEVRDGATWAFVVAGEEELALGTGPTLAWHLVRRPPPGEIGATMEIWLAPALEWYPVRIRKTEASGDVYDMRLSSLRKAG